MLLCKYKRCMFDCQNGIEMFWVLGILWYRVWSPKNVMLVHQGIGIDVLGLISLWVYMDRHSFCAIHCFFKEASGNKKIGGLAEYVTIDIQHVHKIPASLSCALKTLFGGYLTNHEAISVLYVNLRSGSCDLCWVCSNCMACSQTRKFQQRW